MPPPAPAAADAEVVALDPLKLAASALRLRASNPRSMAAEWETGCDGAG